MILGFLLVFKKIDMILLTRPEGGLIGLISLIRSRVKLETEGEIGPCG